MKTHFKKVLLVICFFSLIPNLEAELKKSSPEEIQKYLFAEQNRPNFGIENPLKGFPAFNFFPMVPAFDKAQADKIGVLIKKELEKIGAVKKIELITKNKEGEEGIDLSPFDIDSNLIYEIKNLASSDGKDTGFIRASLTFKSRVDILKTKQSCSPYLWSSNCFLKGNTEKNLEKLVVESLAYLMRDFSESYRDVNSDKPLFNIVGP